MTDTFDAEKFVSAQDRVLPEVRAELAAGRKTSHWMWFVFPQIAGLGLSPTARFYALKSLDEARDWLDHPVLGPRLRELTASVMAVHGRTAHDIFASPDDLKFRACLTLFAAAAERQDDRALFTAALDRFFAGAPDPATLARL